MGFVTYFKTYITNILLNFLNNRKTADMMRDAASPCPVSMSDHKHSTAAFRQPSCDFRVLPVTAVNKTGAGLWVRLCLPSLSWHMINDHVTYFCMYVRKYVRAGVAAYRTSLRRGFYGVVLFFFFFLVSWSGICIPECKLIRVRFKPEQIYFKLKCLIILMTVSRSPRGRAEFHYHKACESPWLLSPPPVCPWGTQGEHQYYSGQGSPLKSRPLGVCFMRSWENCSLCQHFLMLCLTFVQLYKFNLDKMLLLFKALLTENKYMVPKQGNSICYCHFKNKL